MEKKLEEMKKQVDPDLKKVIDPLPEAKKDLPLEMMINIHNYKKRAQPLMKEDLWDYIETGALDEVTLNRNSLAFNKIFLRPRAFRDVSKLDLTTKILGEPISMPICIAPTATHKSLHPDGEVGTAKAAAKHKTLMTFSSLANATMEEVAEAEPNLLRWYQLYIFKDKNNAVELVKRAEKAGYKAIVLTSCAPAHPIRERCIRSKIILPATYPLRNLEALATSMKTDPIQLFKTQLAANLTWEDIKWLKSQTKLPLVLKGIQNPVDAELAVKYGADAIWVSNHGGRMLDGVDATINILPSIIKAVKGKIEVYFDSGVRRGTDVIKALALGANAVFIGRPILWGLACEGEKGVYDVLEILKNEFINAMMFTGCRNIKEITNEIVTIRPML
jgi:(S)-2-hydroxy-acid oxidase